MTTQDSRALEPDAFLANKLYPDAQSVFSWYPVSLEDASLDCVVVLDTNILILPYTISSEGYPFQGGDCAPSIIFRDHAEIDRIVALDIRDGRIRAVRMVLNPSKLRHLAVELRSAI